MPNQATQQNHGSKPRQRRILKGALALLGFLGGAVGGLFWAFYKVFDPKGTDRWPRKQLDRVDIEPRFISFLKAPLRFVESLWAAPFKLARWLSGTRKTTKMVPQREEIQHSRAVIHSRSISSSLKIASELDTKEEQEEKQEEEKQEEEKQEEEKQEDNVTIPEDDNSSEERVYLGDYEVVRRFSHKFEVVSRDVPNDDKRSKMYPGIRLTKNIILSADIYQDWKGYIFLYCRVKFIEGFTEDEFRILEKQLLDLGQRGLHWINSSNFEADIKTLRDHEFGPEILKVIKEFMLTQRQPLQCYVTVEGNINQIGIQLISSLIRDKKIFRLNLSNAVCTLDQYKAVIKAFDEYNEKIGDDFPIILHEAMNAERENLGYDFPIIFPKGEVDVEVIILMLEKFHYKGLFKHNRTFTEENIKRITDAVSKSSYETHSLKLRPFDGFQFDLSNPLWDRLFKLIAPSIKGSIYIDSKLKVSDEVISAIITSIACNSSLHELQISRPLTSSQLKELTCSLNVNNSIEKIGICLKHFSPLDLSKLFSVMKKIKAIDIDLKAMEGLVNLENDFRQLLDGNNKLLKLGLGGGEVAMPLPVIKAISAGLKGNNCLYTLNLFSPLDSAGVVLLGQAMQINRSLLNLYFSVNDHISKESVNQFEFALSAYNKTLSFCSIERNGIGQFYKKIDPITDRNRQLRLIDRTLALDEYFVIAAVLFQAMRVPGSINSLPTDIIRAFLDYFFPIDQCLTPDEKTDIRQGANNRLNLIENNIKERKWKSGMEIDNKYCTLFQPWEAPERSVVSLQRSQRSYMR